MAFKIKLYEGAENEKKLIAPAAKAKLFRKALVITKQYDLNNIEPETLDELLEFVAEVFEKEITVEDIYEGYPAKHLVKLIADAIGFVVGVDEDEEENNGTKKK